MKRREREGEEEEERNKEGGEGLLGEEIEVLGEKMRERKELGKGGKRLLEGKKLKVLRWEKGRERREGGEGQEGRGRGTEREVR